MAATPLFGTGNSTSATSASAATLAVSKPANVADGDVLVIFAYCQFAGTVSSVPSGWTLAAGFANRAAGVYYKHIPSAASESPTTYSFTFSGTGRIVLQCFRMTGATSTPFDAAGTEAVQAGGPTTTLPAASPTTTGAVLLAFEYWNNSTTSVSTITHDAAMTAGDQVASPTTGNTSGTGIAYQQLSASGSTGTRSYSTSPAGASQGGRMVTFVAGPTTQTLSPTAAASGEAFGSPTLTATLGTAPTALGSAEAFGTPVVTATLATAPTGVGSAEAFGTPAVAAVLATAPSSVASAEALGTPALATTVTASPSGIASGEALGSPVLTADLTASPAGIPSGEQAGTPAVSLVLDTAPAAIGTAEAFGSPALTFSISMAPAAIATGEAFGTPAVSATLTVAPPSIVQGPSVGTPTITATLRSAPTGIATGAVFGFPTIFRILTPTGIATREAFGTPAITAGLTVTPTGIAGPGTFGTVTISTLLTVSPAGTPSLGTLFGSPVVAVLPHDFTATPRGIASGEVPGHPKLSGSLVHYDHIILGSLAPRRKGGRLDAPLNGADPGPARWRGST